MRHNRSTLLAGIFASLASPALLFADEPAKHPIQFEVHQLALDANEGVASADVDGDGKRDVIAGRLWFHNPDWSARPLRTIADWNGYVESNGDYVMDVNRDGRPDVVAGSAAGAADARAGVAAPDTNSPDATSSTATASAHMCPLEAGRGDQDTTRLRRRTTHLRWRSIAIEPRGARRDPQCGCGAAHQAPRTRSLDATHRRRRRRGRRVHPLRDGRHVGPPAGLPREVAAPISSTSGRRTPPARPPRSRPPCSYRAGS